MELSRNAPRNPGVFRAAGRKPVTEWRGTCSDPPLVLTRLHLVLTWLHLAPTRSTGSTWSTWTRPGRPRSDGGRHPVDPGTR
ncbi:hypothetical protein BU197_18610 [Streptomyces sp. CBMA291]|nr:hypothetical protein [Streptomyces sp. CBMA291]MBD0717430.1 hypothetical protein [Streptomyces sp. CBMA370]